MAYAKVDNYNGSPTIMIDGKPLPPMAMTMTVRKMDDFSMDLEYYKKLGEAGIRLFYIMCDTLWLMDSALDHFKYEVERILSVVPDACFIARISVHPPEWWLDENPEEVLQFSDGIPTPVLLNTETYTRQMRGMYSFCSKKWQKAAGDALVEMMDEFAKLPYADRIIGFLIAAGATSEWNSRLPLDKKETGAYGDTSPAFREAFEHFLKEKYGENAPEPRIPNLDERFYAWDFDRELAKQKPANPRSKDPEALRRDNMIGSFLNVNKDQHTADFFRAWQMASADALVALGKRVKEKDSGKLTGAFFGSWGAGNRITGNTAVILRVLDSPYIDFLSNPGVYENRQPGGFTGLRSMLDAFRLRGKLYIVEDDIRTHLENEFWRDLGELFTPEDSVNVLKREFGREICEDTHAWWFDQHYGGGRYRFEEAYECFRRQTQIAEFAYRMPREKNSEIAFIYDEESVHVISNQSMTELVEIFRNYEAARIGAPVDFYYHNDLSDPNMPDYKLYVFCNDLVLSDKEREAIKAKLRKNNATAIFVYAPGLINPDVKDQMLDVKHVSDITGITCELYDGKISPAYKTCSDELNLIPNYVYGLFDRVEKGNIWTEPKYAKRSYLFPAIFSCDKDAKVLARFCANGKPAITEKQLDGYTSVLYGAKIMTAALVRDYARKAGCHIYNDTEDVVYANKRFLTVHASHCGKVEIALPRKADVIELYENKVYGTNVDKLTLEMAYGETKMFYLK